jgi:methionyl aminopeptidase
MNISEHAFKHGFSVSDELSGHGIGKEFHSLPLVYHHSKFLPTNSINGGTLLRIIYILVNEEEGVIVPGTTFTIVSFPCAAFFFVSDL